MPLRLVYRPLLVSTSKQMPLIVNELQRRGLKFPVLVGGASHQSPVWPPHSFSPKTARPMSRECSIVKTLLKDWKPWASWLTRSAKPALLEQVRKEADLEAGHATSARTDGQPCSTPPLYRHPIALAGRVAFGPEKFSAPCRLRSFPAA